MNRRLLIPATGGALDDEECPDPLHEVQAYLTARRLGVPVEPSWQAAWEEFYRLHTRRIERVVRGFGLPENDMRDCIQETWQKLITVLPRFRHDPARGSLETWLDRVACNGAIDFLRRRDRRHVWSFGELGLESCPDVATGSADPSDSGLGIGVAELMAAVQRLEPTLSPLNRRILRGRLIAGRSVAEVATETGLNHNQICTRCTRLKDRLRKEIERGRNLGC
jgi:RNA polymerase sigma factor (sigma-70 family)